MDRLVSALRYYLKIIYHRECTENIENEVLKIICAFLSSINHFDVWIPLKQKKKKRS